MNQQATQEIAAMEFDLANATTPGDLVNLYSSWMDVEPDAALTTDEVRADLADYIKEFRHSCAAGQA